MSAPTTVSLLVGDALARLRELPDSSVQCCVTSPPYYGLRAYLPAGHPGAPHELGREDHPDGYVANLVAVFREVRRVLHPRGTLWLNLGDSYAAERGGTHQPAETLAGGRHGRTVDGARVNRGRADARQPARDARAIGLKHKDLIGIPWRVAFALQADGWFLRQDIIWHKPNPMPESVRDRCTKGHEYLFLLAKSERYLFNHRAIAEPARGQPSGNIARKQRPGQDILRRGQQAGFIPWQGARLRNRRSVWSIPVKPFPDAHFATFPPALVEPAILAGSNPGHTILDPFAGSGTTGLVSLQLHRSAILVELNPDYAPLISKRLAITQPRLFA